MTDARQIPVCADPDCDAATINRNNPGKFSDPDGAKWYCDICGARFDSPRYREPRSAGIPGGTLAEELMNADPEAVAADD